MMRFIFLISSERSGSNFLTALMNRHGTICGPAPVHLCRLLSENRLRYGDLTMSGNWEMLLEDVSELLNSMTGVWQTAWDQTSLQELKADHTIASLLRRIYETEATASSKKVVFVKENHAWRFLPLLRQIYHQAQFLYLVRDPRDMALSWKKSPNLRGGVLRAAHTWKEDQQASLRCVAQLCDDQLIHVVRYEDLVRNTERELSSICQFLSMPFEPQMLATADNGQISANAGRSADWRNIAQPVMTQNFGKYRDHLSVNEISYIETLCEAEMLTLGYRPSMEPIAALEELAKRLEPQEPWEKPAYLNLPAEERAVREQRRQITEKIRRRPIEPLMEPL